MEKVFARVSSSSPLSVAVARTSQSPFPLYAINIKNTIKMDDLKKLIEEAMKKAKSEMKDVNILIAGRTGVGKSTLINAVFEGNFATTGSGKPITQKITEIRKEGIPIVLTDTKGLEIQDYEEIKNELQQYIKNKNNDANPNNHIHMAWICIDENSRRIEDAEIDLCNFLSERVPVIGVITKALHDDGFRNEVRKHFTNAKNIVRVNSVTFNIGENKVPITGLNELVDLSMEILPEAQRNAFAVAQKVDMKQRINRAHKIVAGSALTAAGAGAIPIPFSDAATLVPIQVGMLAGISYVFGLNTDKALLSTLVSSTITGVGATFVGRTIVANIAKFFPGIGSAAGAAISGATAAAVTTLFGETYIKTLELLLKNNSIESITIVDITNEFKKQLKIN